MAINGYRKYRARKVAYGGYVFDSMAEAERYKQLEILTAAGVITQLVIHPVYLLQDRFKRDGHIIRKIEYEADFAYTDAQGRAIVEDVKGVKTADYKIKRKLFLYRFPALDHKEIDANDYRKPRTTRNRRTSRL